VPIVCFWLFTERLLILCNVNPEIAHLAYAWVVWQALTIWPVTMEAALRRFLVAQSIVLPQMVATVVSVTWHVMATYWLVRSELGFLGAIVVIPMTYWVMLIVMVIGYVAHYFYYKLKFESMSGNQWSFFCLV
jgi:Na+-driven multidrug efflux pump